MSGSDTYLLDHYEAMMDSYAVTITAKSANIKLLFATFYEQTAGSITPGCDGSISTRIVNEVARLKGLGYNVDVMPIREMFPDTSSMLGTDGLHFTYSANQTVGAAYGLTLSAKLP